VSRPLKTQTVNLNILWRGQAESRRPSFHVTLRNGSPAAYRWPKGEHSIGRNSLEERLRFGYICCQNSITLDLDTRWPRLRGKLQRK
jgi:hypothetical protein